MLAGLFVTQMKITKREMRHTLSYVEFDKIAVTIVDDDELDLACVVFHDVSDGWEFGQLLATQILIKYLEANGVTIPTTTATGGNTTNNNTNNTTATTNLHHSASHNNISLMSSHGGSGGRGSGGTTGGGGGRMIGSGTGIPISNGNMNNNGHMSSGLGSSSILATSAPNLTSFTGGRPPSSSSSSTTTTTTSNQNNQNNNNQNSETTNGSGGGGGRLSSHHSSGSKLSSLYSFSSHSMTNIGGGGGGGVSNPHHQQFKKIEYNIEQSVFHTKLSDAFKSMTLPIMYNLQQQRGIEKAAFVSAHNNNSTSSSHHRVLSSIFADWNLEAFLGHLISTSNDLVGGTPQSIVIEGDATNIQVIQVAPSYHLVCYVLKNIDPRVIEVSIQKAVKLLRQVHDLLTHTHSVK